MEVYDRATQRHRATYTIRGRRRRNRKSYWNMPPAGSGGACGGGGGRSFSSAMSNFSVRVVSEEQSEHRNRFEIQIIIILRYSQ